MGECGCGNFGSPVWSARLGESILAVTNYEGCEECQAPLGFTLTLFTPEEARRWGIMRANRWIPGKYGVDFRYLNVFPQRALAEAARDLEVEGFSMHDYGSLAEMLEECGLKLLRRAWHKARKEERQLRRRK